MSGDAGTAVKKKGRWRWKCVLQGQDMIGGGAEGFVEVGAEAADEGVFEELIDADAFAAAFLVGGGANVPAMEVQGQAAPMHFADPYWVKGAGNRFSATGHLYCAKGRLFRQRRRL
jgi:hypothetical protein